MKKAYIEAEIDIIDLAKVDIITSSQPGNGGNSGDPNDEGYWSPWV